MLEYGLKGISIDVDWLLLSLYLLRGSVVYDLLLKPT